MLIPGSTSNLVLRESSKFSFLERIYIGADGVGRFLLLLLLLFHNVGHISAQIVRPEHELRIGYLRGGVLKHKEGLLYDTPPYSDGLLLSFDTGIYQDRAWNLRIGRTMVGGDFGWIRFGDDEVLGHALFVIPKLKFFLLDRSNVKLNVHFGVGLAYLNRTYHRIDNPLNNAIGAHWNNGSNLGLSASFRLSDRAKLDLGSYLFHFSNGLTRSPNSGINAGFVNIGASYDLGKHQNRQLLSSDQVDSLIKEPAPYRWAIDFQVHQGFNQSGVPNGPTFGVRTFSLGLLYHRNSSFSMGFGFDHEYSEFRYEFWRRELLDEETASRLAVQSSLYLTGIFHFGSISARPQVGIYLPYPQKKEGDPIYIKLLMAYHPFLHRVIDPYLGVLLKTHFAVAEHFGLHAGVRYHFGRKTKN